MSKLCILYSGFFPYTLSLDQHVSCICEGCYYRLHQLRHLRWSLDSNSLATLVYAVVNSRIDYCNWCTKKSNGQVTACVERFCAFDRGLSQILHDKLHWLDCPDWVFFKLALTVHRCLNGCATPYLSDYCVPATSADTRQHLHSENRQLLAVPRYRLNTYGHQGFSAAGPKVWNYHPDFIRDPTISADCFRSLLKTYLFARY